MHYAEDETKNRFGKYAQVGLLALMCVGVAAALAAVIYIPLNLPATGTITEAPPPDTQDVLFSSNWTGVKPLGSVQAGQAFALSPVRITNNTPQNQAVDVALETTDPGLSLIVKYPNGDDYTTPQILAPGAHIDLLLGVSTSPTTPPGTIWVDFIFS